MDTLQAVFLGIVQGLTEFLPISSSGHLVIFQKLVGIVEHDLAFDVAVHLGTLLTIFTLYFKTIKLIVIEVAKFPFQRKMNSAVRLFLLVCVGSVPTAIIGFTLKDYFETLFSNPQAVGVCLVITGTILFITKGRSTGMTEQDINSLQRLDQISYKKALLIGLAQGMAIAPGISRSGSTIATGIFLGIDRNTAALFSFMLSIPAILGAGLLQLRGIGGASEAVTSGLGIGLVSAYFSGLLGLWGVLHFVKKGRLQYFSYYLWVTGVVVFLFL